MKLLVNGQRDCMSVSGVPVFSWDLDKLQTHYQVKVASDPLFEGLVWDGPKEKSSASEVEYPKDGSPLVHGRVYYAKAWAWDEDGATELEMASFAINHAPSRPLVIEPSLPLVSNELKVSWSQDEDLDGDKLSYFVEVESCLSLDKKEIGPLDSKVVVLGPSDLPRGRWLRVRVRSFDGFCSSNWSEWSSDFRVSCKPLSPWFKSPSRDLMCLGAVESEWEVPEGQQDGVLYLIELVSSKGDMTLSMGVYGGTKARMSLSGVKEGQGYRLRIVPYSMDGMPGDQCVSEPFSVIQEPSISCSASMKGMMFFGTNDGRIVLTKMPYWNESLFPDDEAEFKKSSSGASSSIRFCKNNIELISGPEGHAQVDRRP